MMRARTFDLRRDSDLGRNENPNETEQADDDRERKRKKLRQRGLRMPSRKLLGLTVTVCTIIAISSSTGATRGLRTIPKSSGSSNGNQYLEIDFEGGGLVSDAYRLGDVFAQCIDLGGLWFYDWRYPNTLAHQYMLEIPDVAHGRRNLTAFLHVIDRVLAGVGQEPPDDYCHDEEDGSCASNHCNDKYRCRKSCGTCYNWQNLRDIQTPSDNELVVHLRLGDVLTDPSLNEVNKSMEELWNRQQGFLNVGNGNQKYDYNKWEFLKLIRRIPPNIRKTMSKCTIVGAGLSWSC
jgi:hypothetical protein